MPESATDDGGTLLCLWSQRTMFMGRLGFLPMHRHPVTVCVVGLNAPLRIETGAGADARLYRSAIIPARLSHSLDASGEPVAVLYNDPDQPFYRRLSPFRRARLASLGAETEAPLVAALRDLDLAHRSGGELRFDAVEAAAARALEFDPEPRRIDKRIEHILDLIRADLDYNHPVEELAEQAGLSPSRLQHLFAEEIGLPLRTFRIWVRLRQAAERMATGDTITSAALDAGFSNSSHFSHAFKETFGVTAASLFKNAPIRLELVGPRGP